MKKAVFTRIAALGALSVLAPIYPAHAVVLEQKWQPGQSLAYQTEINGTANVQIPADMPIIIAGVPIAVEVTGSGTTELHTLKVDPTGVGYVQVRVPKFDLNGQAMGQKGKFTLLNNKSEVTLNGKALPVGDGSNPLAQPPVAMRISPQGRFLGIEELKPAKAPGAAAAKPNGTEQAFDTASLTVATIVRVLPTLWPGRDVQNGETWQAEISWPMPSKEDPKVTVPTQVGKWDLTLLGEETVDGKVLQKVNLEGSLSLDSAQFGPQVNVEAKVEGQGNRQLPTQLQGIKGRQEVKGDVWFDAAAGQIVKTDLIVGARVQAGQTQKTQAFADFTGSVQMTLKQKTA